MNLTGKIVAVTGANGALGKAVTAKAIELGAKVINLDLQFPDTGAPDNAHIVDLTDAAATKALFEKIGPVDALLNVAGGFAMGASAYSEDDEQWQAFYRTAIKSDAPANVAADLGVSVWVVYKAKSRVARRIIKEFEGLDFVKDWAEAQQR